MKHDSWKAKRNQLFELIEKVSRLYGGDDPDWLTKYKTEVLLLWKDNLDEAIRCFESIK